MNQENINEDYEDYEDYEDCKNKDYNALEFFYDEILCNYTEEEAGEVFDGYEM